MTTHDKQALRRAARAARRAQQDKDLLSDRILARAMELPEYRNARTVLFYVDVRDEVRTRGALQQALSSSKSAAVPYCVEDSLELFQLSDWRQLAPGRYGILEPLAELRAEPRHRVDVDRIDLAFVPGVAFDQKGGRCGHGKGYYDRLLARLPSSATFVGLAYDCQVLAELPVEQHDVAMDVVVTPTLVYRRREP